MAASASLLVWSMERADWLSLSVGESRAKLHLNRVDCWSRSPVSVSLELLRHSRLYRNIHSLHLHGPCETWMLDLLHEALPNLTQLRLTVKYAEDLEVMFNPLWRRMRSIDLTFSTAGRWPASPLDCAQIATALGRCAHLRALSTDLFRWGFSPFDQLLPPCTSQGPIAIATCVEPDPDPCLARVRQLHTLQLKLCITDVERLCNQGAAHLIALHTLKIQIAREHPADDVGMAQLAESLGEDFHGPGPPLELGRLTCLARLGHLQHLRIAMDRCIAADPMLPLRLAQQREPAAFAQLRSYEFVGPKDGCYSAESTPTASGAEALPPTAQPAAAPVPSSLGFPNLTSLHLGCCPSMLLSLNSPELAWLCAEVPNVRELSIEVHVSGTTTRPIRDMDSDSLAWCRSASLQSLRYLCSLTVDRPFWSAHQITPSMLRDLHSLALGDRLPNLSFVELIRVCTLRSREQLDGLMKLKLRDSYESSSDSDG